MLTDFHCHILPGIDDGAKIAEISAEMIEMLQSQGVERIAATPHFFAHKEKSVERFLEKRQYSYDKLKASGTSVENIFPGAEISIEKGISELKGIEKLAIEGTNIILLEFPYSGFSEWMPEEIHNISCEFGLMPMIAHLNRYISIFSKKEMEIVLGMKAIFQFNNGAFSSFREKKFFGKIIKSDKEFAFGSDSHNTDLRKPNFDLLKKTFKKKPEIIESSNNIFDKYIK